MGLKYIEENKEYIDKLSNVLDFIESVVLVANFCFNLLNVPSCELAIELPRRNVIIKTKSFIYRFSLSEIYR